MGRSVVGVVHYSQPVQHYPGDEHGNQNQADSEEQMTEQGQRCEGIKGLKKSHVLPEQK
jgi:hypothetical protein